MQTATPVHRCHFYLESLYTHYTSWASHHPAEEKVIFESVIKSPKILIHGTRYCIFHFDLCCHLDKTRFQVVSSLKPRQSNAMRRTLYTSHITIETRSRKLLAENCTRCFTTPSRPRGVLRAFALLFQCCFPSRDRTDY